jgi:hypothetical protein
MKTPSKKFGGVFVFPWYYASMSKPKIGDRVGAISHTNLISKTAYIFGYGVYDGDFVPETAGGWMGLALRHESTSNPRVTLDNGKVVWGCECWWGPETEIRARLEGFTTVVEIDIDESRRKAASEEKEPGIPEDKEYAEVIQTIEGEYPELDGVKSAFAEILNRHLGKPLRDAIQPVTTELFSILNVLHADGKIGGLSFYEIVVIDDELEANLGIVLPNEKVVTLTLVLRNSTSKTT